MDSPRGPIWFATSPSSHRRGAELVRRIAELTAEGDLPDLDLRGGGVQVRPGSSAWSIGSPASSIGAAGAADAAAAELGLVADDASAQTVGLVVDTTDPSALVPFWRTLLGYDDADPLRRDPRFTFSRVPEHRPLRNRLHVDVAVPAALAIERLERLRASGRVSPGEGGYHALVTDADGNEADLLPVTPDGDRLDGDGVDGDGLEDWRVLFEAAVFYPTSDRSRTVELVMAAAAAADTAGVPLLIDVRPAGVRIGSGKDLWEDERFPAVARQVQAAARGLGLRADPAPLRFVQIGFDAVDVPVVREFWRLALRYDEDPRPYVTDINHPHHLGPTVFVSQMEASDHARRAQRNRLHLDLLVPADQVSSRVDVALAAGGRRVSDAAAGRVTVADPEGNELSIIAAG
jgi:hypothetical protein